MQINCYKSLFVFVWARIFTGMGLKDIVTVAIHVLLTFLKKDKVENALWVFFSFFNHKEGTSICENALALYPIPVCSHRRNETCTLLSPFPPLENNFVYILYCSFWDSRARSPRTWIDNNFWPRAVENWFVYIQAGYTDLKKGDSFGFTREGFGSGGDTRHRELNSASTALLTLMSVFLGIVIYTAARWKDT